MFKNFPSLFLCRGDKKMLLTRRFLRFFFVFFFCFYLPVAIWRSGKCSFGALNPKGRLHCPPIILSLIRAQKSAKVPFALTVSRSVQGLEQRLAINLPPETGATQLSAAPAVFVLYPVGRNFRSLFFVIPVLTHGRSPFVDLP